MAAGRPIPTDETHTTGTLLRLLMVEDSADDAELVERELTRAGYHLAMLRVATAAAMQEALESGEWDVIIADYVVPGFGALMALRLLKQSGRDIPFIILSGAVSDEMAVAAMRAGAHDYMQKSNVSRLAPAIQREMQESVTRRRTRQLEAMLQLQVAALDSAANSIVITDRKGTIQWVNSAFMRLTGYAAAEAIGQNPRVLKSGKHDRKLYKEMWETILSGAVWRGEMINQRKDHSFYFEEMTITPVRSEGGEISHFVAVKEDITARKQAEEILLQSREQLEFALQAANLGQWSLDLKSQEITHSLRYDQIFGYTSLLPRWTYPLLMEHILPERRAAIDAQFKDAVTRTGVWEFEAPIRWPDASIHWIGVMARVTYDGSASPLRMIGITSDITLRKNAELALQEREQQFQAILDVLPVGVFMCDKNGILIRSNPAADVIWGASVPLVTLEKHSEYKARRSGAASNLEVDDWALVRAVRSGAITMNEELEIEAFDGKKKTILNSALPIRNSERQIAGGVAMHIDITDRKNAERALIRNEKLASVGRMAATVAHEINNPLAAAINALFLVETDPSLPESLKSNISVAEQELARVAHITKQTLGFYREVGSPMAVDIPEIIDSILNLFAPRLRSKNISLHLDYRSSVHVNAIDGEIRQIVSNLIANSIDALPQNGGLYVRILGPQSLRGTRRMVRITIADSGEGIAKENLQRIFEPFFTTKQSIGTGLGLWVTSELVKKHEGTIRIKSGLGKGTVFTLWLPSERRGQDRRAA